MSGAPAMTSLADWSSPDLLVHYLARQLHLGRLAIVMGAGVSVPAGIPDWETLLRRLCTNSKLSDPDFLSHTPEQVAGHLKRDVFRNSDHDFNKAVSLALYEGIDASFASLRKDLGLAGVSALVMASRRGTVSNVMTFNFDDILERYLRYHGYVVSPVAGDCNWSSNADVQVLHPHGLLPYDTSVTPMSRRIILTRSDYGSVVGDPANPWNQLALSFMRRNTCLFIGLSGNDDRLYGLLRSAFADHAIKASHTMFWGVRFSDKADQVVDGDWEENGVFVHQVADFHSELPTFLFEIVQAAAGF